ncbi:MAG: alcohol dehydrogenase, partial [Metallosphaera sp.]
NAAVEEDTREALRLISERRLNVSRLITHKFSLEEFNEAVRIAKQGKAIKVVITN